MRDFDERLMKAETSDEVKKLKLWMFQEQVKIQAKKDELDELSHKLQEEKRTLERDRNALDIKIKTENKRFDQNEIFMSKKQQIIENAFRQLALDRKALECERLNLEYEKVNLQSRNYIPGQILILWVQEHLKIIIAEAAYFSEA